MGIEGKCRVFLASLLLVAPCLQGGGCSTNEETTRRDATSEVEQTTDAAEVERVDDGPGCPSIDFDGDTLPCSDEADGDPDGDATPNRLDDDSDGDTILDRHEAGDFDCSTPAIDSDSDGVPDFLDIDSDNDTLPDQVEAGDDDPRSYPRDTDGLGTPNFRDIDSDGDGLSDAQETGLGTDPRSEDSDGDGWPDAEEIASRTGDPLDPLRVVEDGEIIYTLWYEGISSYGTFTATLNYSRNDLFLLVDSTPGAAEAAAVLRENFNTTLLPRLDLTLEGLKVGLGVFSGWGIAGGVSPPFACYSPFFGLLRITDDRSAISTAFGTLPSCPEPLDGGSAAVAAAGAVGAAYTEEWSAGERDCEAGAETAGACFRLEARKIVMLITEGDFPQETPPGYEEHLTLEQTGAHLSEQGVQLVGILVQENLYAPPYEKVAALASATGGVDRFLTPLVYAAGARGEDLLQTISLAAHEVSMQSPADITIDKADGADWPEDYDANGDGDPDQIDATAMVLSASPLGWNPPPGFSPSEAVSHIDGGVFVGALPGTRVSYKIHFRNNFVEQGGVGRIFEVFLLLRNHRGYTFETWPVKIIVPCKPGDESR